MNFTILPRRLPSLTHDAFVACHRDGHCEFVVSTETLVIPAAVAP